MAEVRPAGDAVPHDAVLFLHALHAAAAFGDHLLQLGVELAEGLAALGLAAHADDERHVVEHIKAGEGTGHGAAEAGGLVPVGGVLGGHLHDLLELVIVELFAGESFQLADDFLELLGHIVDVLFRDHGVVVKRHVHHHAGDVQGVGDVFIPLIQGVADVVAQQHHVRQGHFLADALLHVHVGEVCPRIAADVVGIPLLLGVGQQLRRALAGGDAHHMVLGIHRVDAHGLAELAGGDGAGPADQIASGLCLTGVLHVFRHQIVQHFS